MADQMLSSATNFAATLTAARLLGPAGLGKVALAIAIAYGVTNFTRGVIGESLLVFQSVDIVGGAMTAALLAGGAGASLALVVGLGRTGVFEPLAVLALMLPLLAFQDTSRYVFFRRKRPGMAVVSDAIWALAQAAGFVLIVRYRFETPTGVLLTWGAGIVASAAFGAAVVRPRMGAARFRRWFRASRELSGWVTGQSILAQTAQQIIFIAIGLFASLQILGVMRAAQTLIGPLVLLLVVFRVVALSELGRRSQTARTLRRTARHTSLGALALAGGCAAALLLGRHGIVSHLFGREFSSYGGIAVPVAITALAYAVSIGAEVGNRAAAAGRNVFITQLVTTALGIPMILALAFATGPIGAVWGMCGQRIIWAGAAWLTFLKTTSHDGGPPLAVAEATR